MMVTSRAIGAAAAPDTGWPGSVSRHEGQRQCGIAFGIENSPFRIAKSKNSQFAIPNSQFLTPPPPPAPA